MSKLDAKDLDLADRIRKVRRFKGFKESNLRNFDERMSFSHCNGNLGLNNNSTYNAPPERERELYEATIKLLQEEVAFLRKQLEVALLKEKTG